MEEIERNIIIPDDESNIRDLLVSRKRWRYAGNWLEGVAHALVGISTILSFISSVFDNKYIALATGCTLTLCMILLKYSTYSEKESSERTQILNRILARYKIAEVPTITAGIDNETNNTPT